MLRLYADEQFPFPVVELLRKSGYDILTVQESGKAGSSDAEVQSFATTCDRAILTHNRRDFIGLHNQTSDHAGIIVCTEDRNIEDLAKRIEEAIGTVDSLKGQLIRINRPSNSVAEI